MTSTVIIGAGIIGCSTAYFLSQSPASDPSSIHLVEVSPQLFRCASGLAGGFLAKDCMRRTTESQTNALLKKGTGFAPSVAPLGALSFALHQQLAERFGGREKWGYSKSTGTSLSRDEESAAAGSGEDWLRDGSSRATAAKAAVQDKSGGWPVWLTKDKGSNLEVISSEGSVAQLDPLRLCTFLLEEVLQKGVKLYQPARVVDVSKDSEGKLVGVRIAMEGKEEIDIACSRIVITAGPWTPAVFEGLFPQSPTKISISALAGRRP